MPITNPWLGGPAPTRPLEREQLEERILNLLSTHNTAVVATVNADGSPNATPVRYFHLGAQLFGSAVTLRRDELDADRYWDAVRWQSDHVERGRSPAEPPDDPLTVITPGRIVYTEHWLRRSGYAPRQTWRALAGSAPPT